MRLRTRRLAILLLVAALAGLATGAQAQYLRIYYPDIEQGSSSLVVSPTGRALLIDAGTGLKAADDDIVLFIEDLVSSGIVTSLDFVIATHYDEDHIGRLEDVLNFGPVSPTVIAYDRGEFNGVPTTFAYSDYAFAATQRSRTTITSGTLLDLGGGVTARCITVNGELPDGSSVPITTSGQFENSASVTVLVEFGDVDVWIGGDLTGNVGSGVSDVEDPAAPFTGDVDVYTLNHHGSRTSSVAGFLNTLKAEVAINQNSVSNNFGHPNTEVVTRILATPSTSGGTPLFIQQNPGNPGDTRSDDSLATAIADPDDLTETVGYPGSLLLISDGTSYQISGGAVSPITLAADSGPGTVGDYPPAVLTVTRNPLVPTSIEGVTVEAEVVDEGTPTVEVVYALDGVGQPPLPMSALPGNLYRATIPAQLDGTMVTFQVRATDGGARVALSQGQGYFSGVTPILTLHDVDVDGLLLSQGLQARVEGNVTAEPGVFHPFVTQMYLQDESGSGVQVFDRTLLPIARGDRVQVVGDIEQFGGQAEINIGQPFGNFGYVDLGPGSPPAALVVTAGQVDESLEGRLIRINNLTVVTGTIPETGTGNLTVSDDGGLTLLTLHVDGDTDIPGAPTPVQAFDVIGIASQFDGTFPFTTGYQIVPRERADLLTDEVNLPVALFNEIHADPHPAEGDANGDGTVSSTQDEFVEVANTTQLPLDISGWTVSDLVGVRHAFPSGTVIPPGEVAVVFGGGSPTGTFGNAAASGLAFTASSGTLGLNNGGDTLTLADGGGTAVQSVTYGSEGGNDQSLVRVPDLTNAPFQLHTVADTTGARRYSPGTRTNGQFFRVPAGAVLLSEVLYDPVGADGGLEWIELANTTSLEIDLSELSLGAGGSDYTSTRVQLSGILPAGGVFVVGGPLSDANNASPLFNQVEDFSPDLQNSGTLADGVALFNVRAAQVNAGTVPIDAVVYGGSNDNNLIDETGSANPPEVGDAPGGSSLERLDAAGTWQIQAAPTPNTSPVAGTGGGGPPPPPPPAGPTLVLSEVFYDASGADDGLEWVEIYNYGSSAIDLTGFSLGAGGSDYTTTRTNLIGTVGPGQTFVVGGLTSAPANGNPAFDQAQNFSPDLQNSGSVADGVALFDVTQDLITPNTVPIDAVVYGTSNSSNLIDETGSANPPDVGDAPAGSSIERVDLAGTWQVQATPTPNTSPLP